MLVVKRIAPAPSQWLGAGAVIGWSGRCLLLRLEVSGEALSVVRGVEGHRASLDIDGSVGLEAVDDGLDLGALDALPYVRGVGRAAEVDDAIAVDVAGRHRSRELALLGLRAPILDILGELTIADLDGGLTLADEGDGDVDRRRGATRGGREVGDGPHRAGEGIRFGLRGAGREAEDRREGEE